MTLLLSLVVPRKRALSRSLLVVALSVGCGPSPTLQVLPKPSTSPPQASASPPQASATPLSPAEAKAPARAAVPVASFPARARELYDSSGDEYMVVTQGDAATLAARKMFELGGNVIYAA